MKYTAHCLQVALAVLGLALLPPNPLGGEDSMQQEAETLLAKACDLSDIRCEGCPPFRLKARVWINPSGARQLGSYSLIWASAKQWREDVSFPDSKFVTVNDGRISWRAWSSDFRPLWLLHLTTSLDFGRAFPPRILQGAKKIWFQNLADGASQCIEVDFSNEYHREICTILQLGTVSSSEDSGSLASANEWAEYEKFGAKYFPRIVRTFETGIPEVEVKVDELSFDTTVDPASFFPPDNATRWPVCEKPNFPTPLHKPEPPYPEGLRIRKLSGTVVLMMRVETDGRVRDAYVLRSSAEEFSVLATKTVKRKWTFKPATCEGAAIPFEVMTEITFKLR